MTKDEFAAGPKWSYEEPPPEPRVLNVQHCAACTELTYVDKDTGLCRPCWRVWRFTQVVVVTEGEAVTFPYKNPLGPVTITGMGSGEPPPRK